MVVRGFPGLQGGGAHSRPPIPSYLLAAARASATSATLLEKDGLAEEVVPHVLAALSLAVAFLEASINQVFADVLTWGSVFVGPADALHIKNVSARTQDMFTVYWEATQDGRRVGVLEKYQAALRLSDAPRFEVGTSPFQDASLVVQLRNWVVHYKGDWIEVEPTTPSQWESALRGRFELRTVGPARAFFPDRVLGPGCAGWAVDSVEAFWQAFWGRVPWIEPEKLVWSPPTDP